uniref:aminotransferase class V-fold PLP-dependent enzyme n=1 Tax=Marinobacter mobilis TaxID=488533 RepID=UPI0035C66936
MIPKIDIAAVRDQFPILQREVQGKPLVYLDNAATSQKPQAVIDVLNRFYEFDNANIHRGVHYLSVQATDAYDQARDTLAKAFNAEHSSELIFVRGTTEAINLIANSWGREHLQAGDEILLTHMEHHANIVPWQLVAQTTGAVIKVVPVTDTGELEPGAFEAMLTPQ